MELNLDEGHLVEVLNQLTKDLNVPFLERRGRDHRHKRSAMGEHHAEELKDAVEQLNERERELLAAVGIARMLLEKGKQAVDAYNEAAAKQDLLERLIKTHKQEISFLREELQTSEEKSQSLGTMLAEAEAAVEKLTGVTQHYQQFLKARTPEHREDHRELLEDMKEVFEERQTMLEQSKTRLERENAKLRDSVMELEKSLLEHRQTLAKLRQDMCSSQQKARESEEAVSALASQLRSCQEECKYKDLDLSVAHREVEKLKEELEFLRPRPSDSRRKTHHNSFIGGYGWEDESDREDNRTPEPVGEPLQTSPRLGLRLMDSLTNRKRNCQVEILEGVQVPAAERECEVRKDPSQEYFILVRFPQTTQAVKLNSPYMDAICTVPTRELYEKAQKNDIPFHKVRAM